MAVRDTSSWTEEDYKRAIAAHNALAEAFDALATIQVSIGAKWRMRPDCLTFGQLVEAAKEDPVLKALLTDERTAALRVAEIEERMVAGGLLAEEERSIRVDDGGEVLMHRPTPRRPDA